MMKRVVCALVLAAMLAGSAFGKVRDFGEFTADVPYGWRARKQDDGTFMMETYDGSMGLGIFAQSLNGITAEEMARNTSKRLKGSRPVYDRKAGIYRFRFRLNGYEWRMAVKGFEEENKAVIVTWAGLGIKKHLEQVLGSIKAKADTENNSAVEETLGSIKAK
ncbi:MAG: hypothetical protein IJT02_06035 [Synergistaceae bacterium]|nr:hypothetical protein [Synergistaceae bacterium]